MLLPILATGCSLFATDNVFESSCEFSMTPVDEQDEVNGVTFAAASAVLGTPMVRSANWTDGAFPMPEGFADDVVTIDWTYIEGTLAAAAWEAGRVGETCNGEEGLYFEASIDLQSALVSAAGTMAFVFNDTTEAGIHVDPDWAYALDATVAGELLEAWYATDCLGESAVSRTPYVGFIPLREPGAGIDLAVSGACSDGTADHSTALANGELTPVE